VKEPFPWQLRRSSRISGARITGEDLLRAAVQQPGERPDRAVRAAIIDQIMNTYGYTRKEAKRTYENAILTIWAEKGSTPP
jgi:hypothetical protein